MKKTSKIIILIILIALVIIIAICFKINNKKENEKAVGETNTVKEEFVEKLEDGTRLNTSNKLKEKKKFEGFEISNLQITEKENVTLLLGTIKNTSQTKQGGYPIDIKIIDKKGNEIITIAAYIGELEAGESTQLSTSATFDYADAYDFIISKK